MGMVLNCMMVLALGTEPPPVVAGCTCAAARMHNGWCRECRVGYVANVPLRSWVLFDALDAHGHDVIADQLKCPTCRQAIKTDGFCAPCKYGYVGGKLYFSALTYALGKGQALDPGTLTCPQCRKHAESSGWCDSCKRGMVGNFAFAERSSFDIGAREYGRLLIAVETAKRCDTCAAVMFTGAECFKCKAAEYAGKKQAVPPNPAPAAGGRP